MLCNDFLHSKVIHSAGTLLVDVHVKWVSASHDVLRDGTVARKLTRTDSLLRRLSSGKPLCCYPRVGWWPTHKIDTRNGSAQGHRDRIRWAGKTVQAVCLHRGTRTHYLSAPPPFESCLFFAHILHNRCFLRTTHITIRVRMFCTFLCHLYNSTHQPCTDKHKQ